MHVPARMVGDTSHASRGTTEQENQEYLSYSLASWINALKQEWKRKLFPHAGIGRRPKNPFYVDFDTAEYVRASAADRTTFYANGRQWGYLSTNDILGLEKMNPSPDAAAEKLWKPVNMGFIDDPPGGNPQPNTGDNFDEKK